MTVQDYVIRDVFEKNTVGIPFIPDLVLCDLMLRDESGMTLFKTLTELGCEVVVTTGHASLDSAIQALRSGASE